MLFALKSHQSEICFLKIAREPKRFLEELETTSDVTGWSVSNSLEDMHQEQRLDLQRTRKSLHDTLTLLLVVAI